MQRPGRPALPHWLAVVALGLLAGIPPIGSAGLVGTGPVPAFPSTLADPSPGASVLIAPGFVPTAGIRPLGPLAPDVPIHVIVALARSDPAGLDAQVAAAYTPGSPDYRHFLGPAEIADRFGPTASEYGRAVAYFRAESLTVVPSPDRTLLTVQGPSGAVARAFGTSFEAYDRGGGWFYSHPTPASLPGGYPWAGAVGLGNESPPRPLALPATPLPSGPAPSAAPCQPASYGVSPCQAQFVYNLSGYIGRGINGTGARIGIVDAYDASENETQLRSDLRYFTQVYSLPYGNVSYDYPVPTSTNLNQSYNIWGLEEALDIEWSRAMAPGASIAMTFAPDTTAGLYGAVDWLVAHHAVDVVTLSWGEPDVGIFNAFSGPCPNQCNASSDGSYAVLHPVFEAAAAEGIGVFSSSGDCGAAGGTSGVATSYPASDPYVTGVGGTTLVQNSSGGWKSESGWSGNASGATSPGCYNQGGSGGGFSPFPRPYWQSGPGISATQRFRGEPDVAALAGSPGVPIVVGGGLSSSGGTSLSSPMWAGIAAIADQRAGQALGFLNPSLYAIGRNASQRGGFHDITQGWNGYNAGAGWDPVTGLGTPNSNLLLPLLSGAAVVRPNITANLTASPRFGPAPLSVTFRASATGGSRPYDFFDVAFGDGNSSLTRNGTARHTYPTPGVYPAEATVFDNASNSSVSLPIAIVVGGGGALGVTLNATPTQAAVGAAVSLRVTVSGGRAPYDFHYAFGDGTYLDTNRSATTHAFAEAGAYCLDVVVGDSSSPPEGASSSPVGIGVGGSATPTCGSTTGLSANLTISTPAADLPGDLVLGANVSGGVPPYSRLYASDDPYVGACQCGIFSTPGMHRVAVLVADSSNLEANASGNVTIYPALVGHFLVNRSSGGAPLALQFRDAAVSGGSGNPLTILAATRWTFGDGTNATGATATHVYANPGYYVAVGSTSDAFGGTTSEAFLIDAFDPAAPPPTVVTANVTPAIDVPAGTLVHVAALATGSQGPYQVRWNFSGNGSAFGALSAQTFDYTPCRASGGCPISIGVGVESATGRWTNVSIPLTPAIRGNATALVLTDTAGPSLGLTPFLWRGSATAVGMPRATIAWTFGDGGNASGPYGNHTYLVPGNYTVSVVATDPYGDRLVRTHAVVVAGIPRIPPAVSGGPNRTSGVAPLWVGFNATASGGAGGPYNFSWEFGDGVRASGASASHLYWLAGQYEANVTVVDRIGSPTTATYLVTVYNTTAVGFFVLGWNASLPSNHPVRVALVVIPVCRSDSIPGCAADAVPFRVAILDAGATAPNGSSTIGQAARAAPSGWVNVTLTTPSTAGPYVLYVWATGPGFSGGSDVRFTVESGAAPTPPGMPLVEIGSAVAIMAAAAAIVGVVLRRRRARRRLRGDPSPSRPRGEGAGRRGG